MEVDTKSSFIRWRCHRGMLELDMILLSFLDVKYAALDVELKEQFIELLEYSDPELFDVLVVGKQDLLPNLSNIIQEIIDHKLMKQ
jgi:antitoxin CptB